MKRQEPVFCKQTQRGAAVLRPARLFLIHGVWAALLALILAACAAPAPAAPGNQATPTRRPRPTEPPTATAARFELLPSATPLPAATPASLPTVDPVIYPDDVNPLTGLRVEDVSLLERRPMVIKITNFPRSVRPQWGLSLADHVYEYFLEGELTRFIGVFYGQDASRVGPIRSARPFDAYLLKMYKGVLAFAYADDRVVDPWVESDLAPFLVIEKPDNCPPMCRIGSENDYNTLYTDTALLSRYVSERGTSNGRQPLAGLAFDSDPGMLSGGREADHLELRYSPMSYHYWEYDAAARRYKRWQDAERVPAGEEVYEPLADSLTGEQIAADNVVVLEIPTTFFFTSRDTAIFDHAFTGSGKGYALRNGKIFQITWERPGDGSMLALKIAGRPYPLKPGNTWFEIVNPQTGVSSDGEAWKMIFQVPPTPVPPPKPTRRP